MSHALFYADFSAEMGNTGDIQLWGLLYASGLGFWLGAYYELFRMVRLLFSPSAISCFFQDVFFFISGSVTVFFVFLGITDGRIYPYLLVGVIVGFVSFYYTIGRFLHIVLAKGARRVMCIGCVLRGWMQPIQRKARMRIVLVYQTIFRKLRSLKLKKPKKFQKTQKNS